MQSRGLVVFALVLWLGIQCRGQAGQIVDMSFVDPLHGWLAVTEQSPAIFRTSDAGKTWTRIPVPGFYRISFFDTQKGLAIQGVSQDEFCIYKTMNGGDNWQKVATVKHEWLHAVDLSFNGANSAFILGEGSGGVGWVGELGPDKVLKERTDLPINFDTQSNTLGIFGDGAGHLWIVGKELVLHSADWGRTWENQYENTSPHIDLGESGVAVPGGRAWFAAANWNIYRTTDYGKHWERALNTQNPIVNFSSLSFTSTLVGCAVGNSDLIFCTTDGGTKWTSKRVFKTFLSGSPFWSKLKLFPSQRGWAIVAGDLYTTEDGGNRFREVFADADLALGIPGETKALKTSINGPTGLAFYNGFLYVAEMEQKRLVRIDLARSSVKTLIPESHNLEFSEAAALASDERGNIWIGDFDGSFKRLDANTGEIVTVAEKSAWPEMSDPSGMAFDRNGGLLVSSGHHLLGWNVSQHHWEQFAGSGAGFAGDGGPVKNAAFKFLMGVAINTRGDIYVADYENCRIRRIDHEKQVVTTIAGTGICESGGGDGGQAILATTHWPSAITVDRKNNVFFIDANRVRRIDADGVITTYAGTGEAGYGGDDGPADEALLNNPSGLAVDPDGNLYIAEFVNNRIRRVDAFSRVITTVAGNGLPHRVDVIM